MNPYEVLGVARDATDEQIKAGYRAASKRTHPDKNRGHEEAASAEFDQVNLAYKVLSDADRRRLYDDTGKVEQTAADNKTAKTLAAIVFAFDTALQAAAQEGRDVLKYDLVAMMEQVLTAKRTNLLQGIDHFRAQHRGFVRLLGRFKCATEGPNRLEQLVNGKCEEANRARERLEIDLATIDAALEIMGDYEFMRDPERFVAMYEISGTASNASSVRFTTS